mgnify:CR=1 FL=1
MKKWIVLFAAVMFVTSFTNIISAAGKQKDKKKEVKRSSIAKETDYDKLMKKSGRETARGGFMTLHKIGGKLSFSTRPFCLNKSGLYFFFVFCFATVVVVSAAASVVAEAALCSS